MGNRLVKYITAFIICLAGFSVNSSAQFKEEAFSQSYNNDTTAVADTADQLFSFKELFRGLAHKDEMKIGTMFIGSVILPGTAQIYNKDYWKLPVVYGGIGALAGTGGYYLHQYGKSKKAYDGYLTAAQEYETANGTPYPFEAPPLDMKAKRTGTWLMAGAGLVYWGSLLDGVVNYDKDHHPHPGRAALYSALLPGLGQIYNGELYKVPIYWGGLMISTHMLMNNNRNYKRFKRIHNEAASKDPNYTAQISEETAKWYRDVYRRYRDYSILATVALYALQVMDANVFAYMHDFEVSDDISMSVEPAVIPPNNAYAINPAPTGATNSYGLRVGLTF